MAAAEQVAVLMELLGLSRIITTPFMRSGEGGSMNLE